MLNKVILIGRLTKDPEIRYASNNTPVARFTLAVDRSFLNANKEREADFINVSVWRNQAENVKKYVFKGSLVAVEGRIQTGSYEKEGKKVYTTDVVADSVKFLDSKKSSEARSNNETTPYDFNNETNYKTTNIEDDPYVDFGSNIEITDDLPF